MRTSTIIGGLATLCVIGTGSGIVASDYAKAEVKRLEQLAEVDEYKSLNSSLKVMSQTNWDSTYNFPLPGLIERRNVLLQDPKVQEYLSSQTRINNLTYISLSSAYVGILMFCLAFYLRGKERQSSSPAPKPA
ncbi:hypothetical protein HZC30_04050 [Candidatus Woesearchaeota archaeon]|nr:hypothetical protein [Candidatus Woesearchaeota archaeon]